MPNPVIRTPYDGLPTHDPGIRCDKKDTKTNQSHKEYCDIHKQIAQAGAGHLLMGNAKTPVYGDFSEIPKSMHEAFAMVEKFKTEFDQIPAEVRSRFKNNPAEMAAFLQDPKNLEESYKLGLRQKPIQPDNTPDPETVFNNRVKKAMEAIKSAEQAGSPTT